MYSNAAKHATLESAGCLWLDGALVCLFEILSFMTGETELKPGDRVKRKNNLGCYGVLKDVREEVIGSSGEAREKGLLAEVKWDNGTVSYFDPQSLERV